MLPVNDGYVLCLFQITPRYPKKSTGERRVVILQHALLENSSVYLLLGEHSLAYRLCVEEGCEVWLSNARDWQGSHLPNYSLDDIIVHDPPMIIDYVLSVSRPLCGRVAYVGMSQGTVQILGSMAVHGQRIERKLSSLVLISPALYIKKPPWFGSCWLVRVVLLIPGALFGRGQFLFGIMHVFGSVAPRPILAYFGWLVMFKMLGIMNKPLHDGKIPAYVQRDSGIDGMEPGDEVVQIAADDSFESPLLLKRQPLARMRTLCFRYVPGSPCPSSRSVSHWLKVMRNGCTMRPYSDEDERSFDYFDHLMTLFDQPQHLQEDQQYHPPIQVMLGELDPVVDVKRTREAMQQLSQRHPRGQAQYSLYERPDFSHVDFLWGHRSIVKDVNDVIIGRIMPNNNHH